MLLDRVKVSTATTGVGTLTLGAADATFQTFPAAGGIDGQIYTYLIENGTNWEIGDGVLGASGTTITRNVIQSQIAGVTGTTALTLAGTSKVSCIERTGSFPLVRLAHVTLGANASSLTLMSSIPQIFTNLKIKWRGKSTGTSTSSSDSLCLQFNGDTGSHYQYAAYGWFGAGPSTYGFGTGNNPTTFSNVWQLYGLSQNNANFPPGYGDIDIYNYAQATEAIGIIGKSVCMQTNTGTVANHSVGYWNNISARAAITSIVIGPTANQILAGAVFDLYGELAGG
jgi:hypothetical protein